MSRPWHYDKPGAEGEARRDVGLGDAIERIVPGFPGYGYRRATEQLHRRGWDVDHKWAPRVMRQGSLPCRLGRRFAATTDSAHGHRAYPDLPDGFALGSLDPARVADVAYIRLPTCSLYLAAILDAYSGGCIGWSLSRSTDTRLALAALRTAIGGRRPPGGFIHHSDRGVQYASGEYVEALESVGARISMPGEGNPCDNAKAESSFKTLKREEVCLKEYRTIEEADANIGHFIEGVYNNKRLHSSLGYPPPVESEAAQIEKLPCTPVR